MKVAWANAASSAMTGNANQGAAALVAASESPARTAPASRDPGMTVEVKPITDADVSAVAAFLHATLNSRIPASTWSRVISVPWRVEAPNHGFMLRARQRVVGAYLAFYSERVVAGQVERFCNLGSWSVLPEYRFHSVRLLKALLAQDGYHFTDLAPSHRVESVNTRLAFRYLDTAVALIPHLPWPTMPARIRITADPDVVARTLREPDLALYRDHAQAAAVDHLVLSCGSESCYVMWRKRWWRGHPLFAAILYVSNPALFRRATPRLSRHLLLHHRVAATLAELRIVRLRPPHAVVLPHPRVLVRRHNSRVTRSYAARYQGTIPPKMYRSATLDPWDIDDLYSELVCVPDW
ncbi:MAG TPA: hypothetical protein VME01_07155 [Solirubrobacteraceae bacterium]|nr:hypothetical protein [Solirubrobacteraceae bacterium]